MKPDDNPIEPANRADAAIAMLSPLPYAADPLPGIAGTIKAAPEHFVVEEVLPYAACGEGEHVYVTFRRTGWNTTDAARAMQKQLGLNQSDVGWGGRKDKTAVVVQTVLFSLRGQSPVGRRRKGIGRTCPSTSWPSTAIATRSKPAT